MTLSLDTAVLWALAAVAYLAPSVIAEERGSRKLHSIVIMNIFLGWTLIGWGVAMAWACAKNDPPPEPSQA